MNNKILEKVHVVDKKNLFELKEEIEKSLEKFYFTIEISKYYFSWFDINSITEPSNLELKLIDPKCNYVSKMIFLVTDQIYW